MIPFFSDYKLNKGEILLIEGDILSPSMKFLQSYNVNWHDQSIYLRCCGSSQRLMIYNLISKGYPCIIL